MKREYIITSIIILILVVILIWGFWGKKIADDGRVCDFGLMEELDVGSPNIYLCWMWHTSKSIDIRGDIEKLFG